MNNMEKVAEMLGVELEEEFTVEIFREDSFKLTEDGLFTYNRTTGAWERSLFMTEILTGEFEIIKLPKQILTEEEKAFLSAVTKPFRNRVEYVCKYKIDDDYERLYVKVLDDESDDERILFPRLKRGTMYKNMVCGRKYSLGDLSL